MIAARSSAGNSARTLAAPLRGLRIVEFEGIGPGPMAGRILAGLGAEVTALIRPGSAGLGHRLGGKGQIALREGKRIEAVDLKDRDGRERALTLVAAADALIEGNRPGVMERLGLGPADCAARNPRLVYGRMTGWGQQGPLAAAAGHDLNYVALTGLLSLAARHGEPPMAPPALLGDGPGALGLAFGIVCALLDVRNGGGGRVVDAAIVDIVAMMGMLVQALRADGQIDAGDSASPFHESPFYDSYACADGRFVTIAALEPQFYTLLLKHLELQDVDPASQYDRSRWPELKARFAERFRSRTRDEWSARLEGTDVCFAPALGLSEAAAHPHNVARGVYRPQADGSIKVTVAPRFQPLEGRVDSPHRHNDAMEEDA